MIRIRTPVGTFETRYDGFVVHRFELSDSWTSPVFTRIINPDHTSLRYISSFLKGFTLVLQVEVKDVCVARAIDYIPDDLIVCAEVPYGIANELNEYTDRVNTIIVVKPPVWFIPKVPKFVGVEAVIQDRMFSFDGEFLEFLGRFNGIYVEYTGDLRGLATAYDLSDQYNIVFDDAGVDALRGIGVSNLYKLPPEMMLTIDMLNHTASIGDRTLRFEYAWEIRDVYRSLVSRSK